MLVSVACSQRSCQAKPFWGFGMSRSCFFSPTWEFVRAQFKAPKLYTPPANHSATALLSTCRSHVTSSRMKDSTRTDEGQPDSCHLSSKTTVLFCLLCDVWGLVQLTLQIGALSDWKAEGEFVFSSCCQFFLDLRCMWFISCGMLREPSQAAQWGAPWREGEPGKGFLWSKDLENIFQFLDMTEYMRKYQQLPHLELRTRWWDSKTRLLGKRRHLCEEIWVALITVGTISSPFLSMYPHDCPEAACRVTHVSWTLVTGHKMWSPGCSTSKMHIQKERSQWNVH